MKKMNIKRILVVCIVGIALVGGGLAIKNSLAQNGGGCCMKQDKDDMKKDKEMNSDSDMKKDDEMKSKESMNKDDKSTVKNSGEKLGEFSLKDINGKNVTSSNIKGKKVYMKFWASWCPACLSSLAETDKLSKENKDFDVVTVVAPNYSNEKSALEFVSWFKGLKHKNTKVWMDEDGKSLVEKIGVRGYPTSLFIGSDGVVVKKHVGHIDSAKIKEIMSEIK